MLKFNLGMSSSYSLGCVFALLLWASPNIAHSQTRRQMVLELGAQRLIYQIRDDQNLHTAPSAYNGPVKIGFSREREKSSLSYGVEFFTIKQPDPSWKSPESIPKFAGGGTPNPEIGGFFAYERTLIGNQFSSKFFLNVGLSSSLGIIPSYLLDRVVPINGSIYNGNFHYNGTFNINSETGAIYESWIRQRAFSPAYLAIQTHVVIGIKLTDGLRLSILPIFNLGLLTIYKGDYRYYDHVRGIQGSGAISSKGSAYGLRIRLSIRL